MPRHRLPRVMVAGGYGAVGRELCSILSGDNELEIVVAGRRIEQARRFANRIGAEARSVDVNDMASWSSAFDSIDLVVMCVDQTDIALVDHVLRTGVDYVDLTADDAFFRKVEALDPPSHSSALLSVGLAPGLTNIMAAHASARLDRVESINIGILVGLGDAHGRDAVTWTASAIFDPDRARASATLDFGQPWGARRVHALAFADQTVLQRTRATPKATTGLAFESAEATSLVFWLGRRLAGNEVARRSATALFRWFRVGSEVCVVAVEALGLKSERDAKIAIRFHGRRQSEITACLAALMVRRTIQGQIPPGIWHSHQVFTPRQFLRDVERLQIGAVEYSPAFTTDGLALK